MMKKIILIFFIFFCTNSFAQVCQNFREYSFDEWKLKILLDVSEKPTLNTENGAPELLKLQTKYFTQKDSPFFKKNVTPHLGYYIPNIEYILTPKPQAYQTVSGEICLNIPELVITIKTRPIIYIAKELTLNSCVATKALKYQLFHHQTTLEVLKELNDEKVLEKIRKKIHPIFANKGSLFSTNNSYNYNNSTSTNSSIETHTYPYFQNKINGIFGELLNPAIRNTRTQELNNPNVTQELLQTCNGEFAKAISLAQ